MKTLSILIIGLCFNSGLLFGTTFSDPEKPTESKGTWIKSEKGTWLGGYKVWYKMDRKHNTIKFSHNKRKWNTAPNAAWQGKQGEWLYIYEGKLMKNTGGKWMDVPDRSFQDMNGNWYRFNPSWELEEMPAQGNLAQAN
jgi:hypothetical protein